MNFSHKNVFLKTFNVCLFSVIIHHHPHHVPFRYVSFLNPMKNIITFNASLLEVTSMSNRKDTLEGIRILLWSFATHFCSPKTMQEHFLSCFSFYCFGWSIMIQEREIAEREAKRHPLKYFFDSSHCSPINPWNIKSKLSGISPSSMIYDFPSNLFSDHELFQIDPTGNYHRLIAEVSQWIIKRSVRHRLSSDYYLPFVHATRTVYCAVFHKEWQLIRGKN